MSSRRSMLRYKKIQQRNLDLDYALAHYAYDSSDNEKDDLLTDDVQMVEVRNDEIMKSEQLLKDDEIDVDIELSTDDKNQLNTEGFMDVDEMKMNKNNLVFLTDENSSTDNPGANERPATMKDIACLLILFKRRHRLSIHCISDLLKLLLLFGVNLAPRSWHQLKNLLIINDPTLSYFYPCSQCSASSTNSTSCSYCGHQFSSTGYRDNFITFSVKDQLEIILNNNAAVDLFPSTGSNTIRDIKDGNVYQQLNMICPNRFLTLTMNIDGVEITKGSQRSIWPILFVLNELPLKQRYAFENTINAGIWSGLHKPSRLQMNSFLTPIVKELSLLEQGSLFIDYEKELNQHSNIIKVFLISACCDKPAQALVQNLSEPIAAFGCGRCECEGNILE